MGNNKKLEILFPEFCNLFGDISNITYLKKCLPEATFYETAFDQEPKFVKEDVDFIYIGPMTEKRQEKVIEKLKPYTELIEELINKNVVFLVTGNAIEIFGQYIENEDKTKIKGLNIFPIYAKRDMLHRHNSVFVGTFEDIEIVGFKSQFTFSYGINNNIYFAEASKGIGINPQSKLEGIRKNNFIATYVIGPILILNPLFTKRMIELIGIDIEKIAFEEDALKAYEQRLKELKRL